MLGLCCGAFLCRLMIVVIVVDLVDLVDDVADENVDVRRRLASSRPWTTASQRSPGGTCPSLRACRATLGRRCPAWERSWVSTLGLSRC